jgi:hypothetical protein
MPRPMSRPPPAAVSQGPLGHHIQLEAVGGGAGSRPRPPTAAGRQGPLGHHIQLEAVRGGAG